MRTFNYIPLLAGIVLFMLACKPKQINLKEELIPTKFLDNPAEMTFVDTTFDFGDIKEGDKVTHDFKFTNTGKNDLLIVKGYGSCGCTVPVYPTDPIKPGETKIVTVQFNSTGKKDHQKKKVVLEANTRAGNFLYITANVLIDASKK